jgi:hypothetical protein
MPRISQFFGIVVTMYYNDHAPPHFHATYGDDEATVAIETFEVVWGRLPNRAMAMVLEWAAAHRDELRANWDRARFGVPLAPIDPLS